MRLLSTYAQQLIYLQMTLKKLRMLLLSAGRIWWGSSGMDLRASPPVWEEDNVAERIQHCISMLYIHGYIPKGARDKAHQKLQKEWNKQPTQAEGEK